MGGARSAERGLEKRSGPGSPRPTCRSRMEQGGAAARLGCGEGPGGLAAPSAQSMTFQRPAPRLGPAAPQQPTHHKPVAAGSPGSPPDGGSSEAGRAHLSARWPRPAPGAVRLPAQGSAALGPRSRPEFARSPSHRLLGVGAVGASGRGCWRNRRGSAASVPPCSLRSG